MPVEDLRNLAKRIIDDVRATEQQKGVAADLLDELRNVTPAVLDRVDRQLAALRDQIEGRKPFVGPMHDAVRWKTITQPVAATEKRWQNRGVLQFAFGAAMIPALLATMVILVLEMPHEPFMLVFL
ncbi:MAG TPA: hypothetical protein VN181_13745, partial [Thermoanaerobaculia bacterium]|nr:hypothetical protein [Thermoanaerobaculia bacterium]